MPAHKRQNSFRFIFRIMVAACALLISSLACELSGAPKVIPLPPTSIPEIPPTVAAAEPTQAPEVQAPTPVEGAASLEKEIPGFWRTKVTGKEIMVFEFKEGGKTTWYYHYNNGQTRNIEGSYSVKDNILTVNMGSPQDLKAELADGTLTVTGPDEKPMVFQRVESVDSPSPTANKNVAADILGKWQDPKTEESIEFKPDGSVTIINSGNTVAGTFTVTNNVLEMKLNDQGQQPSKFSVEIEGGTLAMIAEDGSFIDYVR